MRLNNGISFDAEIDKNMYFIKDPIINSLNNCRILPMLLKIIKLITNKILPIIINGIKGPKGLASCPVNKAIIGVKEPTNIP